MQGTQRQIRSAENLPIDHALEGLLYAILLLAPWPLGCASALGEFYLTLAIAAALLLSSARWLTGTVSIWHCQRTGLVFIAGICVFALSAASHLVWSPEWFRDLIAPGAKAWLCPVDWYGSIDRQIAWPAGETVALYCGGSLLVLIRLCLAAGFCVVVGTLPNPSVVLRRTCVVATVSGTVVAMFGLAQHYSVQGQLLYWPTAIEGGLGFGPFVNRNHYPFFLNLTLGLAIGLLGERLKRFGSAWPRLIFSDAAFAWLVVAIGIMLSSLVVCVSRGGVLTAFFAISIVGAFRFRLVEAGRLILLVVLIGVPMVALLIWVGFDIQESRLSMLAESDRYSGDGRWYLWQAALESVPQFPWFGSGGETYRFWETIYPTGDLAWLQTGNISLRADNEFLDVLNEYGLVGCVGVCLMAASVCVQCVRSSRQSGLAAGGAIGLLAVLMHSAVDFGLRVPAASFMATTVMVLLSAQPSLKHDKRSSKGIGARSRQLASLSSDHTIWELNGNSRRYVRYRWVLVSLVLITISLVSVRIRRRYFEAEDNRLSAETHVTDLAFDEAMMKMQRAVSVAPEDAFMREEAVRIAEFVRDNHQSARQRNAAVEMIVEHSQALMQQCPLDWKAYTWAAQYDTSLSASTQLEVILKARALNPNHPDLAYLAGKLEFERNGLKAALPHWRESLAISLEHLPKICKATRGQLSANDWMSSLLPEDPVVALAAAMEVEAELREPMLERTLAILANTDGLLRRPSPGQWEALKAETLVELGRRDEGIALMRRANNQQPENVSWRLMLAAWCIREQRLEEAVREIRIVLTLDPENKQAFALQQKVSGEKARTHSVPIAP